MFILQVRLLGRIAHVVYFNVDGYEPAIEIMTLLKIGFKNCKQPYNIVNVQVWGIAGLGATTFRITTLHCVTIKPVMLTFIM
jgi:hypothetical protein